MTDVIFAPIDPATDPHVRIADNYHLPISTLHSLMLSAQMNSKEVCGLITNRFDLIYLANIHPEPESNFRMDWNQFRREVERLIVANESILGVFHTHPSGSGRPSAGDIAGWPNRDLRWRYFIATASDVYEWTYVNQPEHKGMGDRRIRESV